MPGVEAGLERKMILREDTAAYLNGSKLLKYLSFMFEQKQAKCQTSAA